MVFVTVSLNTKRKELCDLKQAIMSHHEWNMHCVLCIFQHFMCPTYQKKKLQIRKMQSYNLARSSMLPIYKQWRIDFFTVPVMDVHHASPDRVEEIEMNFSFQPHSKAKLPIDSISLSIMGGSCMPKSVCARDGCPYLNADWFCAGCGPPHQTKVSLKW